MWKGRHGVAGQLETIYQLAEAGAEAGAEVEAGWSGAKRAEARGRPEPARASRPRLARKLAEVEAGRSVPRQEAAPSLI